MGNLQSKTTRVSSSVVSIFFPCLCRRKTKNSRELLPRKRLSPEVFRPPPRHLRLHPSMYRPPPPYSDSSARSSHLSEPHLPESVHSADLLLPEATTHILDEDVPVDDQVLRSVPQSRGLEEGHLRDSLGGRVPIVSSSGVLSPALLFQDIEEIFDAINDLRQSATDDEDLYDTESLYRWLVEFVDFKLHAISSSSSRQSSHPPRSLLRPTQNSADGLDLWEMEEHVLPFHMEMPTPNFVAKWLEDVFVLDLAAKLGDTLFVGGADEVDAGFEDGEVDGREPPCPYCNCEVGEETEQHVAKCRYAHEEKERLDRMFR